MTELKEGLEGVIALETTISSIDGKKGILKYRGYNINELARVSDFEEITYLLWFGKLPNKKELSSFKRKLRTEREIDLSCIPILKRGIKKISSMDALRTVVSYLGQIDKDLNKNSREADLRKAIRLTAKFPTIVAYYWRLRQGKKPISPRKDFGHGENFLYMLSGKKPSKIESRAMELDFLLTAEHGLNASSFATRIASSTMSDIYSAVVSGICALKGPLHGAAREKVYAVLGEISSPDKAESYVMNKIRKKQKIMGFGHRVYKTTDPRAKIFRAYARDLGTVLKNNKWFEISERMADKVQKEIVEKKGKPIYPNVDFWTGSIYRCLKIPYQLTTGIFAIGRISGWIAHILEQDSDNRLIRPRSKYIGKKDRKYSLIEERR